MIKIYTDGSCDNTKKDRPLARQGGIGIVYIIDNEVIEHSEGKWMEVTSARMEVLAILKSLQYLDSTDEKIVIYSDNQYCVNAVNKGWLLNWIGNDDTNRPNFDLWQEFYKIYRNFPNLKFKWVRGHDGNIYNELADKLANEGRRSESEKTDQLQ